MIGKAFAYLSGAALPWVILGAFLGGVGLFSWGHYIGRTGAEAVCEAAQVKEGKRRDTERDRLITAYNKLLAEDIAKDEADQERADATPDNPNSCLDRDAVKRLRSR